MNPKNHPVFKLRKWILSELQDSDVINVDLYNGIDPIIPVQDVDELSEKLGSMPYMFYFSIPMPTSNRDNIHIKEEMLYINILANNYTEISGLSAFLVDLLGRADMAAEDANKKVEDQSVRFTSINFVRSSEVNKAEQPIGRYVQELCFCYKFVRAIGDNGRAI